MRDVYGLPIQATPGPSRGLFPSRYAVAWSKRKIIASSAADPPWGVGAEGGPGGGDGAGGEALIAVSYTTCGEQSMHYRRDRPDTTVRLEAATLSVVLDVALARGVELLCMHRTSSAPPQRLRASHMVGRTSVVPHFSN